MELKTFRMLEVTGLTREEAFSKAPFTVMGSATVAFKRWKEKQPVITKTKIKLFMLDYLEKKTKNACGLGFSITIEPNHNDSRVCPCKFVNHVNNKVRRQYRHFFELIDVDTNTILVSAKQSKREMKEIAKEYYRNGFKGNLYCRSVMRLVNKDPIVFEMKYAPSENTKIGTFLLFGIEKP